MKLHIGSGPVALDGWINVDVVPYEGVHVLSDVRHGLPFANVEFIFAEHFIEHLTLADGLQFLRECRRVLANDGVLRLSTPNLDWVWLTHYKPPSELTTDEELFGCLEINRAFHGWGHQFLYNSHVLGRALRSAGFAQVSERAYGESEIGALRDLERHERHRDLPDAPSVLVVEATGHGESDQQFEQILEPYLRDAITH
ncbi:MAG TPA: methyltransferase domain-containing protein [Thermoanaerobaculia bacterium]|nr:methyltransferase domain-containing protein [Thermoanaerobaculia bacterium]